MSSLTRLCRRKSAFILSAVLMASHLAPAVAQQKKANGQADMATDDKRFELTIDNIMRGPGLVGYEQTAVRWSARYASGFARTVASRSLTIFTYRAT